MTRQEQTEHDLWNYPLQDDTHSVVSNFTSTENILWDMSMYPTKWETWESVISMIEGKIGD